MLIIRDIVTSKGIGLLLNLPTGGLTQKFSPKPGELNYHVLHFIIAV